MRYDQVDPHFGDWGDVEVRLFGQSTGVCSGRLLSGQKCWPVLANVALPLCCHAVCFYCAGRPSPRSVASS